MAIGPPPVAEFGTDTPLPHPDSDHLRNWIDALASGGLSSRPMPAPKQREVLVEAFFHLERLLLLIKEWQTDWSALRPTLPSGAPNPDFDPTYATRLAEQPDSVFHPQVLEAEEFIRKAKPK